MKTLKIACEGAAALDIAEIVPFQGALKVLDPKEEAELRAEIETTGFAFPIHIWKLPDGSFIDGKKFMIAGHQRLTVLGKMRTEGWEVPPIPVVYVVAATVEEARQRVLQDVAQYGVVTTQGLIEFATLAQLPIDQVEKRFRLPDINFAKLKVELQKLPETGRGEDPKDVFTRSQKQYTDSIIKQIVMFFKAEDFPKVVARANKKLEEKSVADYSELFMRLLDEDDRINSPTN